MVIRPTTPSVTHARPPTPAPVTTTFAPTTAVTIAKTTTSSAIPASPSLALPATWWNGTSDPDVKIVRSPGSIVVSVPATAKDGWNVFAQTRCRAVGDFDARAHFQLRAWPGADGVYLSLAAADLPGVNTYRTDAFGESFGAYIPPSGGTSVHATGSEGWLRLARTGASITGSYGADGVTWTGLYTGTGSTEATAFGLIVYNLASVAPFAGMPVTVAFDSFELSAPTLSC